MYTQMKLARLVLINSIARRVVSIVLIDLLSRLARVYRLSVDRDKTYTSVASRLRRIDPSVNLSRCTDL